MSKLRMLAFAAFALAAATAAAHAQDWRPDRVYISLGSVHAGLDAADFGRDSWNEFNPGVVLAWENRLFGLNYAAGGFVNSFGDVAPFLGASKFWEVAEGLSAGPFVAISDYGKNNGFFATRIGSTGYVLLGGAQVNYRNVFVQIQPTGRSGGNGLGAVLAAGLTFSLN